MSRYTSRMNGSERRRAERLPVDIPASLHLGEGRRVSVHVKNLGEMGALVQIPHLESQVREGDRAVLEFDRPRLGLDGQVPDRPRDRTACVVVRVDVDLDFDDDGVRRELAVFFDGGPPPAGCEPLSSEDGPNEESSSEDGPSEDDGA